MGCSRWFIFLRSHPIYVTKADLKQAMMTGHRATVFKQFNFNRNRSRKMKQRISLQFAALLMLMVSLPLAANVTGLPDFTELVEKTGPAVVNIRVTQFGTRGPRSSM